MAGVLYCVVLQDEFVKKWDRPQQLAVQRMAGEAPACVWQHLHHSQSFNICKEREGGGTPFAGPMLSAYPVLAARVH